MAITKILRDVSHVAAELSIHPVDVFRLVAQGRLAGTPIASASKSKRPPPEYRFTKKTIEALVDNGLDDLRTPIDGVAFEVSGAVEKKAMMSFKSAAMSLVSDQMILSECRKEAKRLRLSRVDLVKSVSFTINQPPPEFLQDWNAPAFGRSNQSSYFGLSLKQAFVQSKIRKAAPKVVLRILGSTSPMLDIPVESYRGPDRLRNVINGCVDEVRGLSFRSVGSRSVSYDGTIVEHGGTREVPKLYVSPTVFISMDLATVLTPLELHTFADSAF